MGNRSNTQRDVMIKRWSTPHGRRKMLKALAKGRRARRQRAIEKQTKVHAGQERLRAQVSLGAFPTAEEREQTRDDYANRYDRDLVPRAYIILTIKRVDLGEVLNSLTSERIEQTTVTYKQ